MSRATLLALLVFAACTDVDETSDGDFDGDGDGKADGSGPPLPFTVETPKAARTPSSIDKLRADNSLVGLVTGSSLPEPLFDVFEQRIVKTTAEPISVTIRASKPTARRRVGLATDAVRVSPTPVGPPVICVDHGTPTSRVECEQDPISSEQTPDEWSSVTRARWQVRLVDATGARVDCSAIDELAIRCMLPAGTGTAYRVIVAADGFRELWPENWRLSDVMLDGHQFTGLLAGSEVRCDPSQYQVFGAYEICNAHWVYERYWAMDRPGLFLTFPDITISANGATRVSYAMEDVLWEVDVDLPGQF